MSFYSELKRRKVIRVGIAYVVAAWLIAQVADLVTENFLAPVWVMQMIITLLLLGLPVALVLAWAFDLTLEGIVRTDDDTPAGQRSINSKHFYVIIASLVVVVSVTLYLTWPPEQEKSIAVLPFEDLSPKGDQAYFGNGIADELRIELQRLDGLRVAGRMTSIAFAQSSKEGNTNEIVLGVDSILEGSVRKDGDHIRITAQLIDTEDGFPIWTESYDRELADIFETQEDIASAVTGALGVRLGVGGVNEFQGAGTQNVEAYEAYLQAVAIHGPGDVSIPAQLEKLELATQLDPEYAAAWARLAGMTIASNWNFPPHEAPAIFERAYPYAKKAVDLNPDSALAHTFLGAAQYVRMDWIGGEQSLTKAIELLADRETVGQYGNMLMRTGRIAAARTQFDRAESLEPLGGRPERNRQFVSIAQGKYEEARKLIAWKGDDSLRYISLEIALNEGNPEVIKTALQAMHASNIAALCARVLNEFDSPETVLSILWAAYEKRIASGSGELGAIAMLAAYFGDPELALHAKTEDVRYTPARLGGLWFPVMSEVRRLPEFKQMVADLNLVAYWRSYGWADTCRPLGDDDFECD